MSSALEKGRTSEDNVSAELHSPERRALEKKLLRKIDLRMSILIVIYILNYIDRNNAAAARKRGLETDLKLKGQEFPTLLSILYVGYIIMQIPSNMFLNWIGRPSLCTTSFFIFFPSWLIRTQKDLPACMMIWGMISCLTGVPSVPIFLRALIFISGITTNFVGALLTRFFLGFVEAAFFPGALFLLSKWYKRDEIGLRTAILYCGNIISNAFGSLMASGILAGMQGKLGHDAWRWLFFIEGALTVFVAATAIFILPDFPATSKWLSPEERELALLRMTEDAGVGDQSETEHGGPLTGLWLALSDWRVWWLAFALTAQVVALSFNAYFPTLSATLLFNPTVTLLLCAPPFAVAALAAFLLAQRVGERCYHMCASFGLGILGFVIAISTMNTAARYISLFLMAQSYAGLWVRPILILDSREGCKRLFSYVSWMSNSFPRPPSKRAVALALMNAFSQLGNIAGEYVWPTTYAICIACSGTTIIMCFLFRLSLISANRKLDQEEEEQGVKTRGFRYIL
ncbi:MFS general substrate transporter [Mycena rosella]|uniref:MFS general substrate transporter n=1 Tax=Mycena rosella TaxID=1033263 RepID=A0AAD7GQI2_MYCRO|nr:MFS general substrate transporter [Mycena rosella]